MIRNIFYFGLGAVASAFISHAGVPLWSYFTQVINWDVAEDAARDVGGVVTKDAKPPARNN
ncbi:MAG: hypothetical protein ACFCU8_16325 [Thermosynechococcaceae cyanobacterium]